MRLLRLTQLIIQGVSVYSVNVNVNDR